MEYDNLPAYCNGFIFNSFEKTPDSKAKNNTVKKKSIGAKIERYSICDWTINTIQKNKFDTLEIQLHKNESDIIKVITEAK